jgi:hypothetical protein
LLHEEPRLRRDFGEDYNRYCQKVRRWIWYPVVSLGRSRILLINTTDIRRRTYLFCQHWG